MADQKLTELDAVTSASGDDLLYIVDAPGGSPSSKKITVANLLSYYPADGRLTLESGVPVSTSDQTAKTTIYYTPYIGDGITLYDGTQWSVIKFTEISIAVPNTSSQMYDIFVYNNSGTATLELLAWTSDTARATALVMQNGILCKTGALTRRYVGSFRTTSTSGQTEDSEQRRFLWNYYNRLERIGKSWNTTASWTYATETWQECNGGTGQVRHEYVTGVAEEILQLVPAVWMDAAGGNGSYLGLKIDGTTSADCSVQMVSSAVKYLSLPYPRFIESIGYHYCTWVEYSATTGTYYGGTSRKSQIIRKM